MANLSSFFAPDSHAPSKPPYFDGRNNGYWKKPMQAYIEEIEMLMWEVIENGLAVVAQVLAQPAQGEHNAPAVAPVSRTDDEAPKRQALNAKAKHLLYCSLFSSLIEFLHLLQLKKSGIDSK